MKIDCELVRDFYPLYEENELSPSVKNRIDEHLDHCQECSQVYNSGIGLSEYIHSTEEMSTPKNIDDKIGLRFKLRRMKVIALFLLTVIIVSVINNYAETRDKLVNGYHYLYLDAEEYPRILKIIKDERNDDLNYYQRMLSNISREKEIFRENLNFIEKNNVSTLFVNTQPFFTMIDTMQYRYIHGIWSSKDEEVFKKLNLYMDEFKDVVESDYKKFNEGKSPLFELANTEEISKFYERMNELSYFYNRFKLLPEDVTLISESDLAMKIKDAFNIPKGSVSLEDDNYPIGTYRFNIKGDDIAISGKIDGYTGQITQAFVYSHQLVSGKLLEVEKVKKSVTALLEKLYPNLQFDIKYLGKNNHISSNVDLQLYSFSFTPMLNGYSLYAPFGRLNVINFNARTGKFYGLDGDELAYIDKSFYKTNMSINASVNDGLKTVEKIVKAQEQYGSIESLPYKGTVIIKSLLHGDYTLVYLYGRKDQFPTVYINVNDGMEDKAYYWH